MLSPGQILHNRYRIIRLLGQGGFGAVYEAYDTRLNGPCAVKETLLALSDRRMFSQEASILFNLRHPNLPRVLDQFEITDQGQYLIMDFIGGENLEEKLTRLRGPLLEAQSVRWIRQICDALEYMHRRNPPVIHRDVKPANIRIAPDETAYLVDFGLAKVFDPDKSTAIRAGSPGYTPFEQYGKRRTDARTDIYALGATLYHVLTGIVPIDAIDRVAGETLVPPSRYVGGISPQIDAAVQKAMEVLPENRFQSAAEFKSALCTTVEDCSNLTQSQTEIFPQFTSLPMATADALSHQASDVSLNAEDAKVATKRNPTAMSSTPSQRNMKWLIGSIAVTLLLWLGFPPLLKNLGLQTPMASITPTVVFGSTSTIPAGDLRVNLSETVAVQNTLEEFQARIQATSTQEASAKLKIERPAQTSGAKTPVAKKTSDINAPRAPDGMILVPAGEFMMGSMDDDESGKPPHPVYLDAFYIDIYEVTNLQFVEFLNEKGNQKEGGYQWYQPPEDTPQIGEVLGSWLAVDKTANHPVEWVTWYGAKAYCEWRGARLPTEAEWEKAARGGLDGMQYPWGNESPTCRIGAAQGARYNACANETVAVGSFAPNAFGVYDMAGNSAEWVSSRFQTYPYRADNETEDPIADGDRVIRGGGWWSTADMIRVFDRGRNDRVNSKSLPIGFRCAQAINHQVISPTNTPVPSATITPSLTAAATPTYQSPPKDDEYQRPGEKPADKPSNNDGGGDDGGGGPPDPYP